MRKQIKAKCKMNDLSMQLQLSSTEVPKTMPNLMNTDQLTKEVDLCGDELCSGLACPPEL